MLILSLNFVLFRDKIEVILVYLPLRSSFSIFKLDTVPFIVTYFSEFEHEKKNQKIRKLENQKTVNPQNPRFQTEYS